ncbi:MAG: hypothetical protein K9W42_05270 [Candidatus Heimdallarchaeota archaeon]|nr:hypothetical protein [Candidatus Heimdallarchaeota archaeon]
MPEHVQVAPLGSDYKRIIQIDRQFPSKGITLFILKSNDAKRTSREKQLSENLKHLRNYCELVSIRLKIQAIDFSVHNTYFDIMFEFVKYFLDELPQTRSFLLNLGDENSIINLALLNASEFVKTYFDVDITMYVTTKQHNKEYLFTYPVQGTKDLELDLDVDKKILQFIEKKMLIKEMEKELNISIGSISNRFHQFKEKGLITIEGRDRELTAFGRFILAILAYKER